MDKIDKSDKKRLFSLFENLNKDEIENKSEKTRNSDILIIDGNNAFLRGFMANPALNSDGEHVGGIDGFFKSIGYGIRMLNPTRCIIVFDGKGGSQRRRAIYKNYKNGRKTRMRLNRTYEDLATPDIEDKSVLQQMQKVAVMCHNLPVSMMAIDNIEADDSIAFLCTEVFNNEDTESITIMSADKDFYQLINDKVKVYSPTKKKIYGPKEVFDEFGITSRNFVYYRILDGDKSDNVEGVKGIGTKTAMKAFPQITTEEDFDLDTLLKYADDNRNGKLKAHKLVCEHKDIVERNFALMQLGDADISSFAKIKIQDIIDKKVEITNAYEFTALLKKYKLFSVFRNHHIWLKETFDILDFYVKQS